MKVHYQPYGATDGGLVPPSTISNLLTGAGRGNRTPTLLPTRDFESRASTNSAIPALGKYILCIIATSLL